jgi:chromosome segregation ATPase
MSSKLVLSTFLCVFSIQAYSAVDCAPYQNDVQLKTQMVSDFSYEIEKLQVKVQSLETRINEKLDAIGSVQVQIDQIENMKLVLQNQKDSLQSQLQQQRSAVQAQIDEARRLNEIIAHTQYQIDNLPAASAVRREALRENMRAKKMLEVVNEALTQYEARTAPIKAEVSRISREQMTLQTEIQKLEQDKVAIAETRPTLNSLRQMHQNALDELQGQDLVYQDRVKLLDEAQEKVQMCFTYNVKYPTSLQVARDIHRVGCKKYVAKNFQSEYKMQAQAEVIQALCK